MDESRKYRKIVFLKVKWYSYMHLPFDKMFAHKSRENRKGMQYQKGVHSISLLKYCLGWGSFTKGK